MNRIAIRREDGCGSGRCVPLVPDDVMELVAEGVPLAIQPSEHRVYCDAAYEAAGAAVREDIDRAHLILGMAPIPEELVDGPRAWMCFSHLAGGAPERLDLLRALLDAGATLLDYALIADEEGVPLLSFRGEVPGSGGRPSSEESTVAACRLFSAELKSLLPSLASADFEASTLAASGLHPALRRACIVWRGDLVNDHGRLAKILQEHGKHE